MEEDLRRREQTMLRRCVQTLRDYNVISIDAESGILKQIKEMSR